MSNVVTEDAISGNIINAISDDLGEIFQRNFKNFSNDKFLSDLKKISKTPTCFINFSGQITHLLDIHAPTTKLSIKEKKICKNLGWQKKFFKKLSKKTLHTVN